MKDKLSVIKIGGNIVDDEVALTGFLHDFSRIDHAKVLVHGGGKLATRISTRLGIKTVMNKGRRITSAESLDVALMVYAGLANKKIVATLQGEGCNALGLSGSDADCIRASKRPPQPVDFGWVGDIESVNAAAITAFLAGGLTPVFCAISHDGKGQLLNTNADTIAAEIAIAMSDAYDTELVYCLEKNGVLRDVNDEDSVITSIDRELYAELKDNGTIHAGMLPKLENCFYALSHKVQKVLIGSAKIITNAGPYTTLTL